MVTFGRQCREVSMHTGDVTSTCHIEDGANVGMSEVTVPYTKRGDRRRIEHIMRAIRDGFGDGRCALVPSL
jgi:hypothetical protein